jgi:hypothetical protein
MKRIFDLTPPVSIVATPSWTSATVSVARLSIAGSYFFVPRIKSWFALPLDAFSGKGQGNAPRLSLAAESGECIAGAD